MLKRATIHFECLFDESQLSNICTDNGICIIELNWFCKHVKRVRSSQQAIPVLNWVKHGQPAILVLNSVKRSFSLWVSLKEYNEYTVIKRIYFFNDILIGSFVYCQNVIGRIFTNDIVTLKVIWKCIRKYKCSIWPNVFVICE